MFVGTLISINSTGKINLSFNNNETFEDCYYVETVKLIKMLPVFKCNYINENTWLIITHLSKL